MLVDPDACRFVARGYPTLLRMSFFNINKEKMGLIFVSLIPIFDVTDTGTEGPSRVTAEDKNCRLILQAGELDRCSVPLHIVQGEVGCRLAFDRSVHHFKRAIGLPMKPDKKWTVELDRFATTPRSLSGIGSLEARINNLRAIPGL